MRFYLLTITVTFFSLATGLLSCDQSNPDDSLSHIEISPLIVWEDGNELVIRYLKALEATGISLQTNEEYDDDYVLTSNDIILIIQDSQKVRNKNYEQQLAIARKLYKIIYQELGYPDSYTSMDVFLYDENEDLLLKDSHTFNH